MHNGHLRHENKGVGTQRGSENLGRGSLQLTHVALDVTLDPLLLVAIGILTEL